MLTGKNRVKYQKHTNFPKTNFLFRVICPDQGEKRSKNRMILLAFCWAHVRRDFLDAAKSWPDLQAWMLCWVEMRFWALESTEKRYEIYSISM